MNYKIFIHKYLTPRHGLTKVVGKLASARLGKLTTFIIKSFVKLNKVNIEESKLDTSEFKTFNEFFIRELKDDVRPLGDATYVSPADGKIAEFGTITSGKLIQAKGHEYTLRELLAISKEEAEAYENGSYITVYLSPRDYHRVHMPCRARLLKAIFVPGDLYSVNENAISNIENLYARNERMICYFDTDFGPMIQILVGATITGSILTVWADAIKEQHSPRILEKDYRTENIILEKGEYMGAFLMGSTTINIFKNKVDFDSVGIKKGQSIKVKENLANL